ncbi:hypothetical protein PG999_006884, partial [Apiospora kogelbergensis]
NPLTAYLRIHHVGLERSHEKGWHPEKEGTSLKGQVNGLLGRGGDQSASKSASHDATPITSLRDPASFAPPPKRGVAPPPPMPHSSATGKPPAPAPPGRPAANGNHYADQAQQDEGVDEPTPPPKPYRLDTTGLSTSHLPPPPGRRVGADGQTPPPISPSVRAPPPAPPARVHSQLPSATTGNLNQGAVSRLGQAGISVPGFGIGGSSSKPAPPPRTSSPGASSSSFSSKASSHMTDLSTRFSSRFGGGSSSSTAAPAATTTTAVAPPPATTTAESKGTTWAEKQAALRTASNFHKNPSSVSLADARAAAGTANNFRERHGEQVASGMRTANNFREKHSDQISSGMSKASSLGQSTAQSTTTSSGTGIGAGASGMMGQLTNSFNAAVAKKKPAPPPPPPKKKAGRQQASSTEDDAPPPVPMSTRPSF